MGVTRGSPRLPPPLAWPCVSASAASAARRTRRRETRLEVLKRRWFAYVFGLVVPVAMYAIFVGYPLLYSVLSLVREVGPVRAPQGIGRACELP